MQGGIIVRNAEIYIVRCTENNSKGHPCELPLYDFDVRQLDRNVKLDMHIRGLV